GVSLSLFDAATGALLQSTTTDANGFYEFKGLADQHSYRVVETQPAAFLDGKDTVGTLFGGTNSKNDVLDNIAIPVGAGGRVGENYNFGELTPASVSGFVYFDTGGGTKGTPGFDDGIKGSNELGIGGVIVTLTGTDDLGNAVTVTATTSTSADPAKNGF